VLPTGTNPEKSEEVGTTMENKQMLTSNAHVTAGYALAVDGVRPFRARVRGEVNPSIVLAPGSAPGVASV